jgi:hypothetical protein
LTHGGASWTSVRMVSCDSWTPVWYNDNMATTLTFDTRSIVEAAEGYREGTPAANRRRAAETVKWLRSQARFMSEADKRFIESLGSQIDMGRSLTEKQVDFIIGDDKCKSPNGKSALVHRHSKIVADLIDRPILGGNGLSPRSMWRLNAEQSDMKWTAELDEDGVLLEPEPAAQMPTTSFLRDGEELVISRQGVPTIVKKGSARPVAADSMIAKPPVFKNVDEEIAWLAKTLDRFDDATVDFSDNTVRALKQRYLDLTSPEVAAPEPLSSKDPFGDMSKLIDRPRTNDDLVDEVNSEINDAEWRMPDDEDIAWRDDTDWVDKAKEAILGAPDEESMLSASKFVIQRTKRRDQLDKIVSMMEDKREQLANQRRAVKKSLRSVTMSKMADPNTFSITDDIPF